MTILLCKNRKNFSKNFFTLLLHFLNFLIKFFFKKKVKVKNAILSGMNVYDLIIIGGGAAGIFGALQAKEKNPGCSVLVLEKSSHLLSKVKISGGGRCNVTHACFDNALLCKNYPRGHRELLGAFHRFQPQNMLDWLEKNGVIAKKEADGRMFPVTDSSTTIIDCFLNAARALGVEILLKQNILKIYKHGELFLIEREGLPSFSSKKLLLATGSHPSGHALAKGLGHEISSLSPSLFTFNIPCPLLHALSGISVKEAMVSLAQTSYSQKGPLLITHFGLSGPAVIKLSAWAARFLHEKNYKARVVVNWAPDLSPEEINLLIASKKRGSSQKSIFHDPILGFPKRLWNYFIQSASISKEKKWAEISLKNCGSIIEKVLHDSYTIEGKTTYKEEFVTCGGVNLKELNFKTMESKLCPGLYFAGEVLDIDGITGGFNFQNAWTTSFIAANSAV